MAGFNPAYSPDMVGNAAHATVAGQGFPQGYKAPVGSQMVPYDRQPSTAQTWDMSHADMAEKIMDLLQEAVETADGWWFKFAPVKQVKAGLEEWSIKTTDLTPWNLQAENTAPRHVQIKETKYMARMERYGLGLEVFHDNFLTPEGQEEFRIKMNSILTGLIVTQKLCAVSSLMDAKLHWREQERLLQVYTTLADAITSHKSRFGALSKDPLAINKFWADMSKMLKGNSVKPTFNMLIVPEGTMAAYKYGAQSRYHTDASLRGEVAVQKNLTFQMDQFDGILKFPIFEDKCFPLPSTSMEEVDGFKRRAIVGSYAILQYDDNGPARLCGRGEPAIEIVTMPADDFTAISMRMCIENCPRFDKKGSIYAFTQEFLENYTAAMALWPELDGLIDPWVVPYKNEKGEIIYRTAEYMGEQDVRFRDTEFDVELGLCGELIIGLNDREQRYLDALFMVAEYLYRPSTIKGTDVTYLEAFIKGDERDEWGGPILQEAKPGGAGGDRVMDKIAYGWGDIFMVMSLLRQDDHAKTGIPAHHYAKLDYEECRAVLLKIWDMIKRMFPSLSISRPENVAPHRKVGTLSGYQEEDRNSMIATFRGLLERVKHPMWKKKATMTDVKNLMEAIQGYGGGGAQGSIFESKDFKALDVVDKTANVAKAAFDPFIKDVADELQEGYKLISAGQGRKPEFSEFIIDLADKAAIDWGTTPDATMFRFVAVVNDSIKMARIAQHAGDWRKDRPHLSDKAIEAMGDQGVAYAAKAYPGGMGTDMSSSNNNESWEVQPLTFAPGSYGSDGKGLDEGTKLRSPTNPFVPSRAFLASAAVPVAVDVYARAQFAQSFAETEDGIEVSRVHQGEKRSVYGGQQTQYIGAGMAAQVGGPFLRLIPLSETGEDAYGVAEREHMSTRQAAIKHHLSTNPIARLVAFCFILSEPTKKAMFALLSTGLPVPMNFMIVAPFINIDTQAIVFAEGGAHTAVTGMNLLDISRGYDPEHKIHKVNATVHTGTKIIQPNNVLIIEDAKFMGYGSGLELTFFKNKSDLVRYDITRMEKAMFCMDVSPSYTRKKAMSVANPLNLFTGRPDSRYYNFNFKYPDRIFKRETPEFDSFLAYSMYFDFDKVNHGNDVPREDTYRDLRESDWIPGTVWPTRIKTYNPQTGTTHLVQKGTGHLDDLELPMREVLDGKIRFTDLHANSHTS